METRSFPTTAAGIRRAMAWVARRTEADVDTLWVVEGAASYGAILTGTVAAYGYPDAEALAWTSGHAAGWVSPIRWMLTRSDPPP